MRDINVNSEGETLLASALSRTEFLPQYEARPKVFRYARPELKEGQIRAITRLFTSDLMCGIIQVIVKGGESTLHSHAGMDGMWMILSGGARFYGEDDLLLGEFGPLEGVYIPRDVKYWFEAVGDEPLQILQIEGFAKDRENTYTSYRSEKASNESLEEKAKRIRFMDAGEN
jgi:mannose-6-phosphate isomerase-like protein (cupin superfamily)